jgi:putative peptidoglycan lipid II flippase
MQIPVGVLGVSVAVALFPTLSRDAALGRLTEIRQQVAASLRILIFLAAILTAGMTVLAEPLVAVFFQYGLFSSDSTQRTAEALVFFALGLAAQTVVHLLARTFYSLQDTRTPVSWAVIAVALNLPLMVWLSGPMGVSGLALAMSITAVVEVAGLLVALRVRLSGIDGGALLGSVVRSAAAAAAAALVMLGALGVSRSLLGVLLDNGFGRLAILVGISAIGLAIYLVVAAALGSRELAEVRRVARRRLRRGASTGS